MLENKTRKQMIRHYMFITIVVCFALFITFYAHTVRRYNTTILAFNYSFGFISRGFLGTLYMGLNNILPTDILNYESVVNITLIATTFIVLIMLFMFYCILKKCEDVYLTNINYVILFFCMFFVSMYYSVRNFGRPDVYMLFFTFLGILLIIHDTCEWLVIPLSIFCILIHQGYVFYFFNIFLLLLAFKFLNNTGKKRIYYGTIFTLSFLSVSALFIYFQFFSHVNGEAIYDEIVALATMLGNEGETYDTLFTHELLGIDPWEEEWPQHVYNFIELPIYCLLNLPYIILGVRFFKNILKAAETKMDKFKYALIPVFSLTIVPCYILKIDFGRWILCGVAYFALVILALCAMGDKIIKEQLHLLMEDIKQRYSYASLLLIYIVTMVPLYDIHINQILRSFCEWLDVTYLHIL